MEESAKQKLANEDEESWHAAKSMARRHPFFISVCSFSVAIVGVSVWIFIVWRGAGFWTWHDVCVNFAMFFLVWGAGVGILDKFAFRKGELIELLKLDNVSVVRLAKIALERDLARISIIFLLAGLCAEGAEFILPKFGVS